MKRKKQSAFLVFCVSAAALSFSLASCEPGTSSSTTPSSSTSSSTTSPSTSSSTSPAVELYEVTVEKPTHGTVTLSKTGKLKAGEKVEILAIPDAGYEVDTYYFNDKALEGNTFTVVAGENVVSVTFKELPPVQEYGTVRVLDDEVTGGTIEAFLEDGTKIGADNERLPVGTKVRLSFSPLNECYEIKEVFLNGEAMALSEKVEFEVVKGKNFLSGTFALSHPGQGLIRLAKEVEHAKVTIQSLDTYVAVGTSVKITVEPDANYIVRAVSLNGTALEGVDGAYSFAVVEGLNTIAIEVVSAAESLEIVVPEGMMEDTDYTYNKRYIAVVGRSYQLEARFLPEGSYDEVLWKVRDFDTDYLKIDEKGVLTVLKGYSSSMIVTASLKSNPSVSARLSLISISANEYSMKELKNALASAQEAEIAQTSKVEVVTEEKTSSETSSHKVTYDYEAYDDLHAVTTATDENGAVNRYYRGIVDDTYYALKKDGLGQTTVLADPEAITSSNREEHETKVNTFGSVEFCTGSYTDKEYTGLTGYAMDKIFGDYSLFEQHEDVIYDNMTIVADAFGYEYDIYAMFFDSDFLGSYQIELKLNIVFNYTGDLVSIDYSRKDYDVEDENEEVTETTPYALDAFQGKITYGEKGEDTDNFFNIDSYFFTDFTPILYRDSDDVEGSQLTPSQDGVYDVYAEERIYLDVRSALPETASKDIDILEATSSDTSVVSTISQASDGTFYFSAGRTEGETEITISSRDVTKTIKVRVSYRDIEKVEFASDVASSLYVGQKTVLEASVSPYTGVSSTDVTFSIKEGTDALGCTIQELPGEFYGTDWYLVSGTQSGIVTVVATSVADPTKTAEKQIEIKAVPDFASSLVGKTFHGSVEERDWTTYDEITLDYTISFVEGADGMTANIEITRSVEPWYGDPTTASASFTASCQVQGLTVSLTDVTLVSGEGIDPENISALEIQMDADESLAGLSTSYADMTIELTETKGDAQ